MWGRLVEEYKKISEKALTPPADTQQLMELKAYVEKVEAETIWELEKRLGASRDRLGFLVDHASFNPVELRNNSDVFHW